jgi:hypothetical protein
VIIRIIAVDPRPKPGTSDVVVYQVPENSREFELLLELFDSARIDYVSLSTPKKNGKTPT